MNSFRSSVAVLVTFDISRDLESSQRCDSNSTLEFFSRDYAIEIDLRILFTLARPQTELLSSLRFVRS